MNAWALAARGAVVQPAAADVSAFNCRLPTTNLAAIDNPVAQQSFSELAIANFSRSNSSFSLAAAANACQPRRLKHGAATEVAAAGDAAELSSVGTRGSAAPSLRTKT
ncbi:hypothetical protein PHYPSEUDO_005867 [Phytophthora pseudosyringae]|uniref:Uncharacterized protein n=1 Tax=Phytophthora pseudosyringae TaxID=221518 RepID=A0A8T1WG35_9STRA|nr:hypothetical protein PHYPSEUDO_005867 [Phytophthora pseudosyringae]